MSSAAEIAAAADRFVETCWEALGEVATSFSCAEAEAIHELMVACGLDVADEWMAHHAAGDDPNEGDRHRAVLDARGCPIGFELIEPTPAEP